MSIRIAFIGFRHGHVFDALTRVKAHPDTELVAACEEHAPTRDALTESDAVRFTHTEFDKMLADVDCDAVVIGDAYGLRGQRAIKALRAGKHVLSDKPLCCTLDELNEIRTLAQSSNLAVGCMLALRSEAAFRTARRLILDGEIGEIHTASFTGQLPLRLNNRPQWYFEPGMHGGTINDVATHGIDTVMWMTGRTIAEVVAARVWNARTPQYPHFQDGAQAMLRLDNNGGVLADVSYLAPDECGYTLPQSWRFLLHGERGVIEATSGQDAIMLARSMDKKAEMIAVDSAAPGEYLEDFLFELNGNKEKASLTTDAVFETTRICLTAQQAADQNKTHVIC